MREVGEAIGTVLGLIALAFLAIIVGTLMGAITGWVVGLFFGNAILGALASFGVVGVSMWQLGAFLGFVGGFFRTTVTKG